MSEDQRLLLVMAQESLAAARYLRSGGYAGCAASRAYYAMFYAAQALLAGKGMRFSKHSAVTAAFGRDFAKPGKVPRELHRFFLDVQDLRFAGDYDYRGVVTPEDAAQAIEYAERFVAEAERLIGAIPPPQADDGPQAE